MPESCISYSLFIVCDFPLYVSRCVLFIYCLYLWVGVNWLLCNEILIENFNFTNLLVVLFLLVNVNSSELCWSVSYVAWVPLRHMFSSVVWGQRSANDSQSSHPLNLYQSMRYLYGVKVTSASVGIETRTFRLWVNQYINKKSLIKKVYFKVLQKELNEYLLSFR